MQIKDGLEWTFDTVAAAYEKLRPGYVEELYQTIFDYIPIDSHSSVVEIGSGGGQATAPILKTGCSLTTVEYSKLFSEHLKERFRSDPKFSVVTDKFQFATPKQPAPLHLYCKVVANMVLCKPKTSSLSSHPHEWRR